MSEANKALVRRSLEELWDRGNLAVVDELYAADFTYHLRNLPEIRGTAAVKEFVTALRASLPDLRFTIEELIAEGDKVALCWALSGTHQGEWMGIAPTGKGVHTTGTTINRIAAGKIAEAWLEWDALGWLQQVGAVPPLAQAKAQRAG